MKWNYFVIFRDYQSMVFTMFEPMLVYTHTIYLVAGYFVISQTNATKQRWQQIYMIILDININLCSIYGQIHTTEWSERGRFSNYEPGQQRRNKFTVEGGDSENGKNYARNNCVYYKMPVDFPYWCALNSVFSGFNTHVACRLYTICFHFRSLQSAIWIGTVFEFAYPTHKIGLWWKWWW